MKFLFTGLLGSENMRGADKLDDNEWVIAYLKCWAIDAPAPDAEDIARLKTLRGAIKNIVFALSEDRPPDEDDLRQLVSALAGSQMTFALTSPGGEYKLSLEPVKKDWDWALHEIAASFAQVLSSDEIKRIKVCENDECRAVFFDESKNKTRRWCSPACGSLVNVREFRKRQKEKEGSQTPR